MKKTISKTFTYKDYPQFEVYNLEFKPSKKGGPSPAMFDSATGSTYVALSYASAIKFAKIILADAKKGKKK